MEAARNLCDDGYRLSGSDLAKNTYEIAFQSQRISYQRDAKLFAVPAKVWLTETSKLEPNLKRAESSKFLAESVEMATIRLELHAAIDELHSRGLWTAERWAAEQLCGLDDSSLDVTLRPSVNTDSGRSHPLYLLARSHFQFKVGS